MEQYKRNNLNCNIKRKIDYIQRDTFLIIKKDEEVVGYSENIFNHLDESGENNYFDEFNNQIKNKRNDCIIVINSKSYYCHCYRSGEYLLYEFEEYVYTNSKNLDISFEFLNLVSFDNNLDKSKDTIHQSTFENILINTIGNISKFDRVLLYKFNDSWSGKVIAEYNSSNEISIYNQFFPESDIPQYVRELFCKNKIRYIRNPYDIGHKIIYKSNDDLLNIIDGSLSNIINVSSNSHLKHLDTMKIASSYSLSVVVNGKLDGLIICHLFNTSEYLNISVSSRHICENLVKIYSKKLEQNIIDKEFKMHLFFDNLSIMSKMFDGYQDLEKNKNIEYVFKQILFYINADYFISNIFGNCISYNTDQEKCINLFNLINKSGIDVNTDNIFYINLNNNNDNCGNGNGNWVAFFKKPIKEKLKWAGNPELILYNNEKNTYLPRNDFAQYEINTLLEWEIYNKKSIIDFLKNTIFGFFNTKNN